MLTRILMTRLPKAISARLVVLLGVATFLVIVAVWRMNVTG